MTASQDEDLAADYVLGTLDGAARDAVRLRLVEDQGFAQAVAAWEQRLAPLTGHGVAEPPPGLIDSIERRIGATGVELPGTMTRRAGSGDWTEASPGLKIKIMHHNAALGRHTFMAWLSPGAEYADHDHAQDEEIYMIEGDLVIGVLVLRAGDFHVARAGRHHPVHRTIAGCLCLISQAIAPF